MSDGKRGGGKGRGGGTQRGGGHQGNSGGKKESILDLSKYMDKRISVKFAGGREVTGTLKGFDPLMNLVLDSTEEVLFSGDGDNSTEVGKRQLGLVVCRGTTLILISPPAESIANPFT